MWEQGTIFLSPEEGVDGWERKEKSDCTLLILHGPGKPNTYVLWDFQFLFLTHKKREAFPIKEPIMVQMHMLYYSF